MREKTITELSTESNIYLLLFDNVEVLDFAAPFEVFSVAKEIGGADHQLYTIAADSTNYDNVSTISIKDQQNQSLKPIIARNGLRIMPDFMYSSINPIDVNILIIPGGQGTRKLMYDKELLQWINNVNKSAEMVASVCTGSLILARAGLLDLLTHVMTHSSAIPLLRSLLPSNVSVCHAAGDRYTDSGRILTSGGISSGIDLSLHMIRRLYGEECVMKTRIHMEYYADCHGQGFNQVIAQLKHDNRNDININHSTKIPIQAKL